MVVYNYEFNLFIDDKNDFLLFSSIPFNWTTNNPYKRNIKNVIHTPRRIWSPFRSQHLTKKKIFLHAMIQTWRRGHRISISFLTIHSQYSSIAFLLNSIIPIVFLHSTLYLNIYTLAYKMCICVHVFNFYVFGESKNFSTPEFDKIRRTVCVHQHFT